MRLRFIFGIVAPSTDGIAPSLGRRRKEADGHKQQDRQNVQHGTRAALPQPKEKRS